MWLTGQKQTSPAPPAVHETQTMTLSDKAEKLRTQFGMEVGLPVSEVVTVAIAELGLDAQVQGLNLMQKANACIAALDTRQAPPVQWAQVVEQPVMPMGVAMDEQTLAAEARVREAEMRAERAEAELRAREAEMRAHAAEEALAQRSREEAEAKKARRQAEKEARKVKPVAAVPSQVRARSSPTSPDIAQLVRDRGHLHFHAASAYSKSLSEDNRVAAANGCKFVYCCCCTKYPCGAVYNCASSECVCSPFISWIPPLLWPLSNFVRCEGCDAQALGAKQGHPAELGAWYSEGAYMFVVSAERGTLAVYPGDCLQAPLYWCEDV
jgi:hypothetical protein